MLQPLFAPRSVLVIGASTRRENLARNIVGNLMEFGFGGEVFVVGRGGGCVFGHRIRDSLDEVPEGIDLAVILTPARTVPNLVEGCGRKGIRHLVVQSGGFKELGDEGAALELRIADIASRYQMRLVGPNCVGIMSPAAGLAAVFMPVKNMWQSGGVSVAAQSGGVGITYLYHLASENVGLAHFVSLGNKLCLDETDLVRSLAADPRTQLIALYLESVDRGREFFEALRVCDQPVLIQKSNRTPLGRKIAFSHTAALAQDDAVLAAALRQAGAHRVLSTREMIAHIKAFMLPPMRGPRVAVISRSGGHAVLAADAAADAGLELPEFSPDFLATVGSSYQSAVIRRGNPLDLGDLFDFKSYARILEAAAALPEVDAVVMVHEYFAAVEGGESRLLVPKAAEVAERSGKPVLLTLLTDEQETAQLKRQHRYPFFTAVEEAVLALGAHFRHWQRRQGVARPVAQQTTPTALASALGEVAPPPASVVGEGAALAGKLGEAAAMVRQMAAAGREQVLGQAFALLPLLGIAAPARRLLRSADELAAAGCMAAAPGESIAGQLPFPLVAKVLSRRAVHKSDAGGVVLGIADHARLRQVVAELEQRFGPFAEDEGVLLQATAAPGLEMVVGGLRDPSFGAVVMVGRGGVDVERLRDTALRLAPIDTDQAAEMLGELRCAALFAGGGRRPAADVDALASVVATVSQLLAAAPEIGEIDLNPCIVHPQGEGATVVDARIRLRAPA